MMDPTLWSRSNVYWGSCLQSMRGSLTIPVNLVKMQILRPQPYRIRKPVVCVLTSVLGDSDTYQVGKPWHFEFRGAELLEAFWHWTNYLISLSVIFFQQNERGIYFVTLFLEFEWMLFIKYLAQSRFSNHIYSLPSISLWLPMKLGHVKILGIRGTRMNRTSWV